MNVVAFQSKEDGIWDDERWVLPSKKEDMLEKFKDWGHNVKSILSVSSNRYLKKLFTHTIVAN